MALLYIGIEPLMLQNPLQPRLPGFFGKLQPSDLLAPFVLGWCAVFLAKQLWKGWRPSYAYLPVVTLALFTASCLVSALVGEFHGADLAKYAYLTLIYFFFFLLIKELHLQWQLAAAVVVVGALYCTVSLTMYIYAWITGQPNSLVYVYDDFPYLTRAVRLIGPWSPTSKLFSQYLLMFSLLVILVRRRLPRWSIGGLFGLVSICAILTISRAGAIVVAFLMLAAATLARKREVWLALAIPPVLAGMFLLQVVTIWHAPEGMASLECGQPYTVATEHQRFGWYGRREQCNLNISAAITYDTYFHMKAVALSAWLQNPIVGKGPGSYSGMWLQSVEVGKMSPFFLRYAFPLAQSTYLTLLAETGGVGLVFWLIAFVGPLVWLWRVTSDREDALLICIWLLLTAYVLIDLDVQNFRFTYYMIPILAGQTYAASLGPNHRLSE